MRVSQTLPARWAWHAAGCLMLLLAGIGAMLPLMPTTVFLLLALACFGRSSPRWAARLLAHPRLGPPLRQWQQHRVVPPYAKALACTGMALGFVALTASQPPGWLLWLAALLQLAVAGWLLRQPGYPGHTPGAWPLRAGQGAALCTLALHAMLIGLLLQHAAPPPQQLALAQPGLMTLTSLPAPVATRTASRVTAASQASTPRRRASTAATPLLHTRNPAATPIALSTRHTATTSDTSPPAPEAPAAKPAAAATNSVAASPPSPSLPAGQASGGNSRSWEAQVMARLERYRQYPAGARAQGTEGVAYLLLKVGRDGRVLAVQLSQSSGHASLDAAALATVQRASPLPRIPPERPDELSLTLPVEFFLD